MKQTFTFITVDEYATQQLASSLVQTLQAGDVLALEGDLGAGKTTFAQGLARGLGIKAQVDSPTFTIVKEYPASIPFYHMDVYRIDSPDEPLGLEEYFEGEGICLVEWASRIKQWLPEETIWIELFVLPDGKRKIQLTTTLPRVIAWCKDRVG